MRSDGDLLEDHVSKLLDSKQPEVMATVISARMYASKQAGREIIECLEELTPSARKRIGEGAGDLLMVHGYVGRHFNNREDGLRHLVSYVKNQIAFEKLVLEDDEK